MATISGRVRATGFSLRSVGLAAACTAAMLCAASRPQAKVRLEVSTATPFSSMARSIASNDSGIRPFCQA